MTTAGSAFDSIAASYGGLWSDTAIGTAQRSAVWTHIDSLFNPGDSVLDLGCGIGDDALHLDSRGVQVYAIDASREMVAIARSRGVNAHCATAESLSSLKGEFDGVLSNFGVLNCVHDLASVARELHRLVIPGGMLAICIIGPFCLWETAHFLLHGRATRAFRRSRRSKVLTSFGFEIHYPSAARLKQDLSDGFELIGWYGIGVCVPPSYIRVQKDTTVERLSAMDRSLARLPALRAIADHRLFIFRRL
jgi:ubiquinone/menaquinone biosynthesis C-methylase UbiE